MASLTSAFDKVCRTALGSHRATCGSARSFRWLRDRWQVAVLLQEIVGR